MDINDEIDVENLKYKVKELQEKTEELQVELDIANEQLILPSFSNSLPSDEKMEGDLMDIIDKNLVCGTDDLEGILCNRFATTYFIKTYIKNILANCC